MLQITSFIHLLRAAVFLQSCMHTCRYIFFPIIRFVFSLLVLHIKHLTNVNPLLFYSQKLKTDLENEKKQHLKVSTQLNQQNVALAAARRELDLERQRVHSLETQMRLKISDLQTALDTERARCNELSR